MGPETSTFKLDKSAGAQLTSPQITTFLEGCEIMRLNFRIIFVAITLLLLFELPMHADPQNETQTGPQRRLAAGGSPALKEAETKPTPRAADGHPDLTGYWQAPEATVSDHQIDGVTYVFAIPTKPGAPPAAGGPAATGGPREPNPGPYKAELEAKVRELTAHQVDEDPAFHCKPLGVPRAGTPTQIVQTPKLMVFLYQVDNGAGDTAGVGARLIPTDGRPHRTDVDPMYFGDSIGHWEGDTFVTDVTHFTDDTWLDIHGAFHTTALHVIERLTRKGNALRYQATAEDPSVLTKPWVMPLEVTLLQDTMVYEQPPCDEREAVHIVNGANHAGGSENKPR